MTGGEPFDTVRLECHDIKLMFMKDSITGIVSDYASIYLTEDGWDSFEKIPIKDSSIAYITAIYIHSSDSIDFASSWGSDIGPRYYRTTDRGKTWIYQQLSDTTHLLGDIFFINTKIGWIPTLTKIPNGGDQQYDVLFKTTDGGNNWKKVYQKANDFAFGLSDIVFTDEMNGVAVGGWGVKILRTTDGGDSWIQDSSVLGEYPAIFQCVGTIGSKFIVGSFGRGLLMMPDPVGVKNLAENSRAEVYPNPSSGMVTLSYEQERAGAATLEVLDLSGRLVFSEKASYRPPGVYTERINGSGLAPGMYYYHLSLPKKELSGCIVIVR